MEDNGRIFRQVLLLSMLVLIVPLVIFPKQLGTELAQASFGNAFFEFVVYGVIGAFLFRNLSLMKIFKAAAIGLGYRLVLGFLLGLLLALMTPNIQLSSAIQFGMFSYLPGIFIHIAATMFILKPVLEQYLFGTEDESTRPEPARSQDSSENRAGMTNIVITKNKKPEPLERVITAAPSYEISDDNDFSKSGKTATDDYDGFDTAVKYIGEDGSVNMALVVDNEGLLLSNFNRTTAMSEDVAAYAFTIINSNNDLLGQLGYESPEKIEFVFEGQKVVVACQDEYCLMVLSERTADDVINIRINQGLEIIRKHIAERYGNELIGNAEKVNV